jgi:hypothetical protein
MIVVVASISDQQAAAAVERWQATGVDATILTCHDLAQPGWRWSLDGGAGALVLGGRQVPMGDVTGVITRLACVTAFELPFVRPIDREYAASEMHAFLLALLASLPCPVINRPTPEGLCGPTWSVEQWVAVAAREQVCVRPAVRREYAGGVVVDLPIHGPRRVIQVVGDRAFGAPSDRHERAAVVVARAAGAELLRLWFEAECETPTFIDADSWIDLSDPAIADAVRERVAA